VYKDITDQDKMLHVVGEYLADMNAGSKKPQNLVLFQFALEHVARISRIITSPGAQALHYNARIYTTLRYNTVQDMLYSSMSGSPNQVLLVAHGERGERPV
jgi:hypothetical protein